MLAAIVDVEALLNVVLAALVTGVGVTVAFSLSILGATRALEAARDGRAVRAGAFTILATAGLAAVAVAVVIGIAVMTSK